MTSGQIVLLITLFLLILGSAFFSGSETGIMSLNRYRLRHAVRKGDPAAKRIMDLLLRPDRLLGVILIGNAFTNIFASAVTTILAAQFFGKFGVFLATIVLTFLILIFGETAPKTLAALHPEQVARSVSTILKWLLKILYPLVWLVNIVSNSFLRLFGAKVDVFKIDSLSIEELRTLLDENKGKISANYNKMLLRILDLEQVTVEDIMAPRNEIFGIDLNDTWEQITTRLFECPYSYVPLYKDDINHTQGILNLRRLLISLRKKELNNKEELIALSEEVYFVPKDATANQQLLNFRDQKKTIGLVVDEYGDIQGLITLQNILEEIVGEFTQDVEEKHFLTPQKDGSFLVDAAIDVRDLNEMTDWKLPITGPRTLSGLIIEYLEMIPSIGICARIAGYPMEVMSISENTIKVVRIWPQLYQALRSAEEEV